jgi:hypothetical protein
MRYGSGGVRGGTGDSDIPDSPRRFNTWQAIDIILKVLETREEIELKKKRNHASPMGSDLPQLATG